MPGPTQRLRGRPDSSKFRVEDFSVYFSPLIAWTSVDRGVGTAYASQGIQMHRQTGRGGVAGMRRPARNPEAGRMALPRAGLKANGIN